MGDSFSKKEKTKKKAKSKQEKAQKMQDRKSNNSKGSSLEDMIVYVDENGNFTSTPPDPTKRKEINLEDITLGAAAIIEPEETVNTGFISYFTDKGYGFITEDKTRERIFVHSNQLAEPVKENDRVSFDKEKTPKGFSALNVKKIK